MIPIEFVHMQNESRATRMWPAVPRVGDYVDLSSHTTDEDYVGPKGQVLSVTWLERSVRVVLHGDK
jgi:hypothetical protein